MQTKVVAVLQEYAGKRLAELGRICQNWFPTGSEFQQLRKWGAVHGGALECARLRDRREQVSSKK